MVEDKSSWVRQAVGRLRSLTGSEAKTWLKSQPVYAWRILRHTFRLFMDNRGPYQANALAYRSMLSMVPMLVFVVSLSAWIFGATVNVQTNRIKGLLKQYVVPPQTSLDHLDGPPGLKLPTPPPGTPDGELGPAAEPRDVVEELWVYVDKFKEEAEKGTQGGFVILLMTSVFLINGIEVIFNNLWHIKRGRTISWRVLAYTAMTVLIPLMLGLSIYMTAQVQVENVAKQLSENPVLRHLPLFKWGLGLLSDLVAPMVTVWLLFLAMYKWLPNTQVETGSALVAGLFAALSFELSKWGFSFFTARMVESRLLWWGPIGIFLVFLIWVYISWWIILFGAQLTYVIQNYRYVLRTGSDLKGRFGTAYLGAWIMLEIGLRHHRGERVPTVRELARKLLVDVPRIQSVLERLMAANLLIIGAAPTRGGDYEEVYVPGRDLGAITLAEVVHAAADAWRMPTANLELAARPLSEATPGPDAGPTPALENGPVRELTRLLLANRDQIETNLQLSLRALIEREGQA